MSGTNHLVPDTLSGSVGNLFSGLLQLLFYSVYNQIILLCLMPDNWESAGTHNRIRDIPESSNSSKILLMIYLVHYVLQYPIIIYITYHDP